MLFACSVRLHKYRFAPSAAGGMALHPIMDENSVSHLHADGIAGACYWCELGLSAKR
jgi:hypothetical protein